LSLREDITAAAALAFDSEKLGEEVLYNGVPVQAIFDHGIDPKVGRSGSRATAAIHLQKSEVPSWQINDEIIVDGDTWKVKSQGEDSTWYKWVLQLERDRRMKP
jgi:hypothetical protein